MITKKKVETFNSCNSCGFYNMKPSIKGIFTVRECGEIYEYRIGCIDVRLCNNCAYQLKELLNEQLTHQHEDKGE